jgi:hypothetical protein
LLAAILHFIFDDALSLGMVRGGGVGR